MRSTILLYLTLYIPPTLISFPSASTQTPQGCLPPASQERGISPNLTSFGISLYAPRGGECTRSHSKLDKVNIHIDNPLQSSNQ